MSKRTTRDTGGESTPKRTTRRRWVIPTAAAVLVVAAGAAAAYFLIPREQQNTAGNSQQVVVKTQTVERRDLTETVSTQGTLDYGGQHPLLGELGGTVTWLPQDGDVIDRGGRLYSVDNMPVILMSGQLPAWRSFEVYMTDGPDVQQLEDNLAALGFFSETPDQHFDWLTREAVRDWRESLGMGRDGEVEFGRIVFLPEAVRVGSLDLSIGDRTGAGTQVMTLTDQTKIVTAQLGVADQQLAVVGAAVSVRLPDGQTTTGTVASIGAPIEVDNPDGKQVTVPVIIALDDPAVAGDLQRITVTVSFVQKTYEQVLAVPVTALIGLPGGGLGVEKITPDGTTRVPVTTGVFVQGYVEITAGDLAANDEVVAP